MDSIKFYKYHGCGNDFILIEDYRQRFLPLYRNQIPYLCKRHHGIGADGILLLQHSQIADVKMRIFNSDGSEAKMCGNGLRCLVKHLKKSCTVETGSGICPATLQGELVRAALPVASVVQLSIDLPMDFEGHLVNTGTEHLVIFVDDLYMPEIPALAMTYMHHEIFRPYSVNVNFAKVITDHKIFVRTFEKGVEAETLSCGSGGGAVALVHSELTKDRFSACVISQNGEETIFRFDHNGAIWMIGPAEFIFSGTFTPKKSLVI